MRSNYVVGLMAAILLTYPIHAGDWLDLQLPPIEVNGSLLDVARELQKYGIRVCVEEVTLQSVPPLAGLRVRAQSSTLRQFLENLTRMQPDLGWASDHFLMCPLIRLFRKSSANDPRNPLNMKVGQFHINDADLYDISQLVYNNSEEFRGAVNPTGIRTAYAGSRIGGTSLDKRIDIRYMIEMEGWTVRDVLNCLACVSVNNGMSWLFQYDSKKEYPNNFVLRKF